MQKVIKPDEIKELKKQVEDLKSELEASLRREEVLANTNTGIKAKIKRTWIYRVASNPKSKVGKIIRLPRTIFRLSKNPSIVEKIREKKEKNEKSKKNDLIFVPIRFFFGADNKKKINIIMEEKELELLKIGIELANKEKLEARIVVVKGCFQSTEYREMVKQKVLPRASKISFYNVAEQEVRTTPFELEVSREDIFLTRAWRENEEP